MKIKLKKPSTPVYLIKRLKNGTLIYEMAV